MWGTGVGRWVAEPLSPVGNEPDSNYSYCEENSRGMEGGASRWAATSCHLGWIFPVKRVVTTLSGFHHMSYREATMQTAQSSCPGSPPDTGDGWEPVLCRGEINFGGSGKKRGKVGVQRPRPDGQRLRVASCTCDNKNHEVRALLPYPPLTRERYTETTIITQALPQEGSRAHSSVPCP